LIDGMDDFFFVPLEVLEVPAVVPVLEVSVLPLGNEHTLTCCESGGKQTSPEPQLASDVHG
jgi:hypothetical protein